jgi:hypothetical protein
MVRLGLRQCRVISAWRGQPGADDRALRWGSSFHPLDLRGQGGPEGREGGVDALVIHVQVGDGAYAAGCEGDHEDMVFSQASDDGGGVGGVRTQIEHYNVGVGRNGGQAGEGCGPVGQVPGPAVIVDEALHVVFQGMETCCGQDAGLAHGAAHAASYAPCAVERLGGAGEE